jgi:5-methylcytosine-specific restriction enzyme A
VKILDVKPEVLQQAMDRFDVEFRNTPGWARWQEDEVYKFAIEHNGKLYPVKKIVSLATGMDVDEFSGGLQANGYVERLGFRVIEIPPAVRGIKTNLDEILNSYRRVSEQEPFGTKSSI